VTGRDRALLALFLAAACRSERAIAGIRGLRPERMDSVEQCGRAARLLAEATRGRQAVREACAEFIAYAAQTEDAALEAAALLWRMGREDDGRLDSLTRFCDALEARMDELERGGPYVH
jgi:hypothetical protein